MEDISYLILAFGAGAALGTIFTLNLWASVKKMVDEHTRWYVVYGNFVLRISIVMLGFYLVTAGRWERMIAALLGFMLMREIMVRRLGRKHEAI